MYLRPFFCSFSKRMYGLRRQKSFSFFKEKSKKKVSFRFKLAQKKSF
jgi:hypothetical protein